MHSLARGPRARTARESCARHFRNVTLYHELFDDVCAILSVSQYRPRVGCVCVYIQEHEYTRLMWSVLVESEIRISPLTAGNEC